MSDDARVDQDKARGLAQRWVSAITTAVGSVTAIIASIAVVLVWALTGPVLGFSDTWQLIINTSTTVITFNMVFVIQNSQNRDARAIQTKLDDIIHALSGGDDALIGVEDRSEAEIRAEQARVRRMADNPSEVHDAM